MKILEFFRRPALAVFMAALILFASCSSGVNDPLEVQIDAVTLENMHEQIRFELSNVDEASVLNAANADLEEDFTRNLHYTNDHGIEALFEKNGLDVKFLDMFEFYKQFESDADVYSMLIENFEFKNMEEVQFLVTFIEVYDILAKDLFPEETGGLKSVADDRISLGCVLAIASTLATTVGAAFITGGAALIAFLITKGICTASIIEACT